MEVHSNNANSSHRIETMWSAKVFNPDGSLDREYKKLKFKQPETRKESTIDLTVRNKDGSIDQQVTIPFRSFLPNFMKLIYKNFAYRGDYNLVRDDNISYNFGPNSPRLNAQIGVDTYGIIVGADGTAVATSDYNMNTKIANGTGTGQLEYQQTIHENAVVDGSGYRYTIRRLFDNNSGAPVTVQEVGLMVASGNSSGFKYLIARDVLQKAGGAINITAADTQTFEVKYNIYIDGIDGLVKNMLQAIQAPFQNANVSGAKKTNGSTFNMSYLYSTHMRLSTHPYDNTQIDASNGMVVGKGTAAYTVDDYALNSRFGNGAGVDQLRHEIQVVEADVTTGNVTQFKSRRHFTNDYTANQTINEVGTYHSVAGDQYMGARNVLVTPITLQPNQSVELSFVMRTTI